MNPYLHQPRLPSIPPPATSTSNNRRNPLSNALNKQLPPEVPPKPVYSEKKASPPLSRQNAKVQPPSPPPVIQDKTGSLRYQRMSFLGEVSHQPRLALGHSPNLITGRVRQSVPSQGFP